MSTRTDRPAAAAAALACAARGWRVFPLRPGDKRPLPHFTRWETHATTDPDRIRSFWARGEFNTAVACGPSGLIVIDLDTPKPGETPPKPWALPGVHEGADVLAVLCERHGQPFPSETYTVQTRRGGLHLYFTAPPGVHLRNTTGRHRTGLGWLIDTRAHGGYVVAAGSRVDLPDGAGTYRVVHDVPPAPLPDWLTHLLTAPSPAPPPLGANTPTTDVADLDRYLIEALKGETARVTAARPGGRNWALNKAAYNLGRLVGAGALPADVARGVLWDAAHALFSNGPAPFTPTEARATITAGLTAGAARPRTITRKQAA
ncbi:bifunctional DNA primase/polymerase [Actinomadura gamaensis]|uniref:Bifunctional DNA primase/polymerase n=1 Tax=Actinomadura gamaensis TaxID=1763541 RepID=A0ABV9TTJ2_9ACTN